MAKRTGKRGAVSLLRRAASSLANALTRRRETKQTVAPDSDNGSARQQTRRTRRPTDVPIDRLEQEYTPTQTSLKSGFRTDGSDRERDQDSVTSERWNDEDHFTNRSGDPRIGTHGRTYEPGEKRNQEGS